MKYLVLKDIQSSFITIGTLEILKGELLVLIGPSGAGKTSLLNIIAGFAPHKGTITLGQRSIESLPSNKRNIGYLFQDLYLFPHLTVYQNLKVALRAQKLTKPELRKEIERNLDLFRIGPLSSKYPDQLSGGEKQRVAIARSVASKPKLLLLDEPFSHLDYRTARYLRNEFKKMQQRLQITTIFVTHNLQEARELGDRIAVLENGTIEQIGSSFELLLGGISPDHGFLEKPNILEGFIQRSFKNGLVEFKWNEESLLVTGEGIDFKKAVIWPEDIHISIYQPSGSPINCFKAELKKISLHEHMTGLQVQVNQCLLAIVVDTDYFLTLGLELNDEVYVLLRLWCLRGFHPNLGPAARQAI